MSCRLCGRRRAKRACPALGEDICPLCCGTKRLVEIHCPADCVYLASARQHPPAVVQRRHERDRRFLAPFLDGLDEAQSRLFLLVLGVTATARPSALPALQDRDAADAAGALAATMETADRGIIYQHNPTSLPAQRLAADIRAALDEVAAGGGRSVLREASVVLRRVEGAARTAAQEFGGGDTAWLDLIDRVLGALSTEASGDAAETGAEPERLIIPG
jgi:hypothetical protein